MTDPQQTLSQLIIAATPVLVPVAVALLKSWLPAIPKPLLPLVAIGLGSAIDVLNAYVVGGGLGPVWGGVLGAAGVGVREVLDQTKAAVKRLDDSLPPDPGR